ncbi:hypothetical protein [Xenorhabdus bovienii]|uniref:Uncharacterized protein n=1 Tax=Xenorhabdus bovienii str. Intermedium TaxID=1379677 RepID=A0A077Q8Y9_XENBV|nr:hypothetical protein [Xenorhabdus bovienii]CDH32742.1 hypothetical protein XBI1_2080005 [Xenorhabdus bovienii str. Intermedium]
MEDIDYMRLLEIDICPVCGVKDCVLKNPKAPHAGKVMHKTVEAYCKNDMRELKKIIIQKFSQYNAMFNHRFADALKNDTSMSSIGLLKHYREDSGAEISLSRIGVQNRISDLIKKPGAFKRTDGTSIHSRFISQIQNGDRVQFNNSFSFGTESAHPHDPLWAIGGAKVIGTLTDTKVSPRGDNYNLSGRINYRLEDKFTDPYDTFNWFEKDWNPNGVPFDIRGEWSESVNFDIDKNVYENKIKPLIDKQ